VLASPRPSTPPTTHAPTIRARARRSARRPRRRGQRRSTRRRPRATASADDLPANTPRSPRGSTAAYDTAGLARDPSRSWIRRARLSGLIPWLTCGPRATRAGRTINPRSANGTTLELRATWRLDRLLFDGRELQVATIEAARHRERRRLATRVIRAYFAWRRAAVAAAGLPTSAPRRASLSQPLS